VERGRKERRTVRWRGGQLEVSAFIGKPARFQKLLDIVGRLIGKGEPTDARH